MRRALAEMRRQREHFTQDSYSEMVRVMLDALRRARTLPAAPPANDEMRLVTMMFVDVVNSTRISGQMDAGDWKNLINEAHRRVAVLIGEAEGQIGQYLGDGVLAFFGAQRSRGDDALRAVTCAVEIMAAINSYANDVFLEHGVEFAVRVGISTGRVLVGMIGSDEKQELLALGLATNLAARLQNEARPGHIVIDETTYSRVRNHYATYAHDPALLRGFEQPVRYYTVIGRHHPAALELTTTLLNGLPIPFVNRDAELAMIDAALETTLMRHRFQAMTLVGDLGIGKSRLLQEVLRTRRALPIMTLVMAARSEKQAAAGGLLRELLIAVANITDDLSPAAAYERVVETIQGSWNDAEAEPLARAIAQLGGFQPSQYTALASSARPTFEPMARWLRRLAENGGLLLVVDNLQWADPLSLQMLDYLAAALSHAPVLLLAAARPPFLTQAPLYLRRVEAHQVLPVGPLPEEDMAQIVQSLVAQVERVPETLSPLMQQRAGGNPLFLLELLGTLFDQGVIFNRDDRWRFNIVKYHSVVMALPDGLVGVMQSRLDDLSPEARYVIQVASVVGVRFWASVVLEVSGAAHEGALAVLVARGLIAAHETSLFENDAEYSFQHTLYRETAYELIPRQRRAQIHQQIANWLTARIASKPELYPTLADHFEASDNYEAALFTCLEAMQDRLKRHLVSEALTLNDRGLALARNITREVALPVVVQFWTARGQIMTALRRYDEASAASQSALMLLKELPTTTHQALHMAAWQGLAQAYTNLGRYNEAFQALIQAHEVRPYEFGLEQGQILQAFGTLSLYTGRLEESQAYLHRALDVWRKAGLPYNLTYRALGQVALESGDIATALSYFEQGHEYDLTHHHPLHLPTNLRNLGVVSMTLMQYEQALALFDEAQSLLTASQGDAVLLTAYRGLCLMHLGEVQAGFALVSDAMQTGERFMYHQWQLHLAAIHGLLLLGDAVRGREQALTFVEQVKDRNPLLYGRGLFALGRASQALGEAGALDILHEALDYEQMHGGRELWLIYEALADAHSDPDAQQYAREQAAQLVQQIGKTLYQHPDLQAAFLSHSRIASLV